MTDPTTDSLADQRRKLPDQPGVYLFRNDRGRVIYVGKANSVRKRVASHFAGKTANGFGVGTMLAEIRSIECIVVATEAEALLTEQGFIKQYRPRFNIRLRDDKSYPFIAISMDENFPRVYFTRERHRRDRLYFGPYSSAKRVRGTLTLLSKLFMLRSCTGPEPGRRSGSPCLDYHIKRCAAPCVGYVSKDDYRQGIDRVIDFLNGRYKLLAREISGRMQAASDAQEFEQAAVERNRLRAVESLLERQRVANESVGTLDAVAIAVAGTDANAQVFQVRDGALTDRQSFYLTNEAQRPVDEVLEEFVLQYYESGVSIPAQVIVQCPVRPVLADALAVRRGGPVEIRAAERGEKKRILELAVRNAGLALDEDKLAAERRRDRRTEALDGLQQAIGLDTVPVRIECFDISNLMGTHTVASMVVLDGALPKKSDYRRFKIRTVDGPDDFASMAEVLGRRLANWERQQDISPHDPDYDSSFASLPNLVVIDGGKGQLSAGIEALDGFRRRGVVVVSLAKRLEEVFLPGVDRPLVLAHDTAELQLLQRIRDEAHRFAITHHRTRRDRAMTASVLDDLPGVGPARKRALIDHFGSADAVVAASADQLQSVPGLPAKVGRELHSHLHRV
ncbi:MAG TPA: excinuclease ABC subunit UvrC [Solirubrobacteraceae bacterium]|nr:excinuclease ABC subunit UvrC [Solirubrobacteraceae bacterium]